MKRYLKPIFVLLFLALLYAGCYENYTYGAGKGLSFELAFLLSLIVPLGLAAAALRFHRGAVHVVFTIIFALVFALSVICAIFGLFSLPIPDAISHAREALYLLTPALAIAYTVASALSTSGKGGEPDAG